MTGFELRLWRKGLNLTQEQAAAMFGLTRRTWNRYEKMNPPKAVDLAIVALSIRELETELNSPEGTLSMRLKVLISEINKISDK